MLSKYWLIKELSASKYAYVGQYLCLKTDNIVVIKISTCWKYDKYIYNEIYIQNLIHKYCTLTKQYVLPFVDYNMNPEFEPTYVVYPFIWQKN
jgi:hypothetical protein